MSDGYAQMLVVDSIRGMELELQSVRVELRRQKAIIDRYAGAKEGSRQFAKALQALEMAKNIQQTEDELEESLRTSKKELEKVLDCWYPVGSWQNKVAKKAALTSLDWRQIAAVVDEPPSHVRSLVADVRRRLMR